MQKSPGLPVVGRGRFNGNGKGIIMGEPNKNPHSTTVGFRWVKMCNGIMFFKYNQNDGVIWYQLI